MIQVSMVAELEADEDGPHEVYKERFTLPAWFAATASEAHAQLLTAIVTERYIEMPTAGSGFPIPFRTDTVRFVAVWEGGT